MACRKPSPLDTTYVFDPSLLSLRPLHPLLLLIIPCPFSIPSTSTTTAAAPSPTPISYTLLTKAMIYQISNLSRSMDVRAVRVEKYLAKTIDKAIEDALAPLRVRLT